MPFLWTRSIKVKQWLGMIYTHTCIMCTKKSETKCRKGLSWRGGWILKTKCERNHFDTRTHIHTHIQLRMHTHTHTTYTHTHTLHTHILHTNTTHTEFWCKWTRWVWRSTTRTTSPLSASVESVAKGRQARWWRSRCDSTWILSIFTSFCPLPFIVYHRQHKTLAVKKPKQNQKTSGTLYWRMERIGDITKVARAHTHTHTHTQWQSLSRLTTRPMEDLIKFRILPF